MALREKLLSAAGILLLAFHARTAVLYVDWSSHDPTPPYTNWVTAATNLQSAVDAASAGDEILVTNGLYRIGGRAVVGTLTNRVAVDKPLALRSVNGPQFTRIQGWQVPDATNGDGAIRCVYLASGASLSGFTLTRGATRNWDAGGADQTSGGGAWCESASAVISNCVLAGNASSTTGGGVSGGTLHNCVLTGNLTGPGDAMGSGWGGGAASAVLNNCTLTGNTAVYGGGGAAWSTLNNCVFYGNQAGISGGGAAGDTLSNCTLSVNQAGAFGGGASGGTLNNCILSSNTAPYGPNYWGDALLNYSCATPLPTNGVGNIALDPSFVSHPGGNLRLQAGSPCINAGCNAYTTNAADLERFK